jgi:Major tropism determinant N-terminal domain
MANRIQLRRDTAANWTRENPILSQGEPGFDLTENKLKVGDGVTAWADLAYASGSGSGDRLTTGSNSVVLNSDGILVMPSGNETTRGWIQWSHADDDLNNVAGVGFVDFFNAYTGLGLSAPGGGAKNIWFGTPVNPLDPFKAETSMVFKGDTLYLPKNGYIKSHNFDPHGAILTNESTHITIQTANTSTQYAWEFGEDGVLTLPSTVGDIKRDGVSVLGGGGGSTATIWTNDTNGCLRAELSSTGFQAFTDATHLDLQDSGEWNIGSYQNSTFIGNDQFTNTNILSLKSGDETYITTNLRESGNHQWTFGTNGILTLPFGSTINDTPSAPGNQYNGQAVEIKPGGVSHNNQLLRIYPTVPDPDGNHLHLTSGDLTDTDLFLGDDHQFVQIAVDGKVCIGTYGTEGHFWQFGTDGVLTLPAGGVIKNSNGSNYGGGGFVTTSTLVNSTSTVSLGSDGKLSLPGDLELLDAKNIIKSGNRTALFKTSVTFAAMGAEGGGMLTAANFTIRTVNNTSTYTLTFASSTPTAYSWSGFGMDMATGIPINVWGAKFTATANQDYTIATFETVGDTFQIILTDYTTGYLYRITSVLTTTSSSSTTVERIA